MKLPQWANPLLSMVASLTMCVLLNISQDSKTTSFSQQVNSDFQDEKSSCVFDSKNLTLSKLSVKDKLELERLEEVLKDLKATLKNDTARLAKWREEMKIEKHENRANELEMLLVKIAKVI